MASFPKLSTGAVTQYPSSLHVEKATQILHYLDGSEQRFSKTAGTVRSWSLRMDQLTEDEALAIEDFFVAQQGQAGQFSFIDPWDGTEHPDCSFDVDSLRNQVTGEGLAKLTLIIRSNKLI